MNFLQQKYIPTNTATLTTQGHLQFKYILQRIIWYREQELLQMSLKVKSRLCYSQLLMLTGPLSESFIKCETEDLVRK